MIVYQSFLQLFPFALAPKGYFVVVVVVVGYAPGGGTYKSDGDDRRTF